MEKKYIPEKEFVQTKIWKRKRDFILKRDKYLCQHHLHYGRRIEARVVHHIKPYSEYPELALDNNNLISLCASCHNKCHPEKGGRSNPPYFANER